ncbi:pirin family protein [Sphaerisporangium sp. NBC_01403]|uniref:pirin family protein n=1 Tax=Sphaerisporangium sp. NBC_01403 TaxID=2903599 RepID=UPI0032433D7E
MSNLERDPRETLCGGRREAGEGPARDLLTGRDVVLGGPRGMKVTRTLPNRDRRMVGAWCFVDHYGPEPATMRVPPHPHTGLQTVSWLLEGEVLHRDSLGSEQLISPGQLNLMTAGRAISHSEESPGETVLHGVQLWVALPDASRNDAPSFEHHPVLPVLDLPGVAVTVIAGELGGLTSPARVHTPLAGAEMAFDDQARVTLPVRPDFEYAALTLSGGVEADGVDLDPGPLLYLGSGRSELAFRARRPSRVLLLGGEPFEEEIVMWWNFVGRSHEEIERFRKEWSEGAEFGTVDGFDGAPLPAPALPATPLKPRGRHR